MSAMPVSDFAVEQYLPFGLGLGDIISVTAGLAVVTTFFAIWQALRTNTALERRMAQIADKKEAMRQAAITSRRQRVRMTPSSVMRELVMRFDLLRSKHATDSRLTLARAGLRSRDAMITYLFARLTMPVVFAAATLLDHYTLKLLPIPANLGLVAAGVAGVLGYFAPGIYINNQITKRSKRIQLALPDGLDLMVICAEAGLSLDATLVRVSRELENTWEELAEELGITAAELTFLPDRRQAFDNLAARTDMSSIRGVVNTLTQTAKFGTPLAHSLRVLAAEFRDARMFKAEEKAARLPALMTVPMILFILPTLFIVLMGPAALGIIDTFNRGNGGGGTHPVTVTTHSGDQGGGITAPPDIQATDRAADETEQTGGGNPTPATLTLSQTSVAVGQELDVSFDARSLSNDFDLRVVLVPATAPDTVGDANTFFTGAKPITATEGHVSLTARIAGPSEVRLYYVPHNATTFAVAARASVDLTAK